MFPIQRHIPDSKNQEIFQMDFSNESASSSFPWESSSKDMDVSLNGGTTKATQNDHF